MKSPEARSLTDSPFDLTGQQTDVSAKIVVAFERISEGFRVLLWEKAKELGLTPIQIQILIFLRNHPPSQSTVSYLSREFNLTKATVSDAVGALERKGLVEKVSSENDARSMILRLTAEGLATAAAIGDFANPLMHIVDGIESGERESLWRQLSLIILRMSASGVISRQRMCFNCQYFSDDSGAACRLIGKKLEWADIRIDCPEFIDAGDSSN